MSKKDTGCCPVRKTSIGGQALMEGIMMRGPGTTALAVRNPKGEIIMEKFPTQTKKRPAICRFPIIRGVIGFIDSMTLGYKCLMRSAEISGIEELEAELAREKAERKAEKAAKKQKKQGDALPDEIVKDAAIENTETVENSDAAEATETEVPPEEKKTSPFMSAVMVLSILFAVVIMVGLFILLPSWIYTLLCKTDLPVFTEKNAYFRSVFEGVLRVILLVGYMSLMCLMKDIRRTFMFHGAEHKTIFCYEAGLDLTVENIRMQKRFHPRCGTSFLILMALVSIFVGFFIPPSLPLMARVGTKILLVPIIMGLGYELIKLCGRHDNLLTRIISMPGVWLQHITVFEPDDEMIECAIVAMKEVVPENPESDHW